MNKYSLWVMPNKGSDLYNQLKESIRNLAKRFSTPEFEPHLTLLPSVLASREEIISQTEQLAKRISPYQLTLDNLDYTDYLYQCLVIRAKATSQVLQANKKARDIFKRHRDTLYVPHMSLVYGTNIPNEAKIKIISEIGDQFKDQTFTAGSIYIETTQDDISEWKTIKKIPLKK